MDNTIMTLQAANSKLDVFEDKIVITALGRGSKTIGIRQITGIQFKQAKTLSPGFLHFNIPGGKEKTLSELGAAYSENAVLFSKKENECAARVKEKIEALMSASQVSPAALQTSGADEILKYKSLLEQGVITEAEFEQQKKKILNL